MKLETLDLNLLLAFDVLSNERSVTRAAARLGVSQPAMSGTLARLRQVFGDPLFERAAGAMRPTPLARRLAGPVSEALNGLRVLLEPSAGFRPDVARREFRLGMTDYAEAMLLPAIVRLLAAEAPNITLRTVRPQGALIAPLDNLRDGVMDVSVDLLADLPDHRSELRATVLGSERLVGVLRNQHPAARGRLSLREFARLPQIRVVFAGETRRALVDTLLGARGLERRVSATLSHLGSVAALVAESDLLGIGPERFMRWWARTLPLRLVELPFATPAIRIALLWHERRTQDPAVTWLRGRIEHALVEPVAGPGAWPRSRRARAR